MVGDGVSDLITRIKNASDAGRATVSIPHSKLKLAILEKLVSAGFVASLEKHGKKVKKNIEVVLKYGVSGPEVRGVKRISKPGKRVYLGVSDIRPVKFGHGALVLSTPKGILTDEEARKEKVGGEAMFAIW